MGLLRLMIYCPISNKMLLFSNESRKWGKGFWITISLFKRFITLHLFLWMVKRHVLLQTSLIVEIISNCFIINANLIQRLCNPRVILSIKVLCEVVPPITHNPFPDKLTVSFLPVRGSLIWLTNFLEIVKFQKIV